MRSKDVFLFIDETGSDEKSTMLAVACIITDNPDSLRSKLDELKLSILRDSIFKTLPSINKLSNKGFHYCEDHKEIQSKVIELIRELSFRAYICYQEKEHDFDASAGYSWYDKLFSRLMFERLRANKNASIKICFEQHDSRFESRRSQIEGIINNLVDKIELCDRVKFLITPQVRSAGKEEPCLVIADYIAAIFKGYATKEIGKPGSLEARNFERIRPKVRVIHNYVTDEFFTRKHPFSR
jgi:dGTP triphosphohydrolase